MHGMLFDMVVAYGLECASAYIERQGGNRDGMAFEGIEDTGREMESSCRASDSAMCLVLWCSMCLCGENCLIVLFVASVAGSFFFDIRGKGHDTKTFEGMAQLFP